MSLRSETARIDKKVQARTAAEEEDASAPTSRERVVHTVFLALLLIAATIAVYQQAWHAGFIWDDDVYVTNNPLLVAADGLKKIWFSLDSPSQYFPLVYTSFRFEHMLWGGNPAGYHWVNLALHVANALVLWRLLALLRIPGAWLAAALFALHPVQVESVAWISERKNVLMALFYLLAVLAWVKFVAGKHRGEVKYYLLALLCFAFALFSKTTACTLPVALLLISWLKRGSVSWQRVLQVVPFAILGLAMGLVSIWWERYHQGTQGDLFSLGVVERVFVAARAFWFYLAKLAWPAQLAFIYPRWSIAINDPRAYVWLGACLLLVIALWVLRRWLGRGPETALIFFAATLAPSLGFVMLYTFRYTFVADHYQYLACIGPLALAAAAVTTGIDRLGRARVVLAPLVCAALLVPLGLRTWRQGAVYANPETLWQATLAVNPDSSMVHNNLAILLLHNDRVDDAIGEFQEALRLDPNDAEAHFNLANAFLRQGRFDAARPHYERALQLNPRMFMARTNLSFILLQEGDVDEAVKQLEAALKVEPRSSLTRSGLGAALMRLGRVDEAIAQYKAVLEIDPNDIGAHNELAHYYLSKGRFTEAREHARRVAEANPNDSAAATQLGMIAAEMHDPDEALRQFQKAAELDPQNAGAHYNMGTSYLDKGDADHAIEQYRRAIEIRPSYAAAHLNLANLYAQSNRVEEAIHEYEEALQIRPDYSLAHKNLATLLNRIGRADEAMEHLQISRRLDEEAGDGSSPR